MSKNKNLNKARVAKNNEFYTRIYDIEQELKYYKKYFENKIILCNCDDPNWSSFSKHFRKLFDIYNLKKLICTSYNKDGQGRAFIWTKELGRLSNGKIDENNPYTFELKGNGDYRSDECLNFLKEADIICTNPPFSEFKEFIRTCIQYKKDFLVIGNYNAVGYKEFFKYFYTKEIKVGYTFPNTFILPDGKEKKFGNIAWFTNLPVNKHKEIFNTGRKYFGNESEYTKYDNFDALNIDFVKDIPMDYNGYMGVPITFLNKINTDQFEIIDLMKGRFVLDTLKMNDEIIRNNWKIQNTNNQENYTRLLIRNKNPSK